MVFDKRGGAKREIENLDSYYLNFEDGGLQPAGLVDACQSPPSRQPGMT